MDSLQAHEAAIRLTFFLAIFAAVAAWELVAPRRRLGVSKTLRWVNNLGLVMLNTVVLRLLFPTAAAHPVAPVPCPLMSVTSPPSPRVRLSTTLNPSTNDAARSS